MIPRISTLIRPRIPTLIPRIPIIPTLIPRIPTLISRIPIIPTLISRITIIPHIQFPDSPFRLLQIAHLQGSNFSVKNFSFELILDLPNV